MNPRPRKEPTAPTMVRFPKSLLDEIRKIAERENRPLRTQIIVLLREALDRRESLGKEAGDE